MEDFGFLEPANWDDPYFLLQGDVVGLADERRGAQRLNKTLFRIVFAAIGTTFFPHVLELQSDGRWYRFYGRLYPIYHSSDGELLYRMSEEQCEFV